MTSNDTARQFRPIRQCSLIVAALLGVHGNAAAGQEPSPSIQPDGAESGILVVGRKADGRAEREFVEAVTAPSRNGQLARVEDAACPKVFGLSARDERLFVARMRRVADAVGLRAAKDDCRPNLVVFIVPDRKAAIEHWRLKRPDFFDGMSQRDIDALAEGSGAAVAWQIVHVKGAGRRAIAKSDSDMFDYLVVPEATPYRLGSQIQLEFFGSFLVIEASALGNASVRQVADYAAMRTFANTDPEAIAAHRADTILSLLTPSSEAPPLSLTHWDLEFLRGLYATPTNATGRDQQRAIARSMERTLPAHPSNDP